MEGSIRSFCELASESRSALQVLLPFLSWRNTSTVPHNIVCQDVGSAIHSELLPLQTNRRAHTGTPCHLTPNHICIGVQCAGCVQTSIGSRNSAFHNAYRSSLQSSTIPKPRHSPLQILMTCVFQPNIRMPPAPVAEFPVAAACAPQKCDRANDPSAGSPTETLLRLLLPLSDKVH